MFIKSMTTLEYSTTIGIDLETLKSKAYNTYLNPEILRFEGYF